METAPKIVLQNPYRILGVYVNSPRRDIESNKGRALRFLEVNRSVEFPLDLKGILPALNRTLDLMNEAEAHLAIVKEQIKYAQFWFLQKMSPLDDIAFNHLLAGNMAGAIEIWAKQDSISSLQNRVVCYLIQNKLELAVKSAEKLYEKFGDDYISKVDANCTLQMTVTDLLHQFVDSLGEDLGMQKLLDLALGAETKTYISSQTIGPLINKISSEVDKTKKVDHKDSKARIEAARKLVENTKETFSQLKSILPVTDSQYQMIADKLGLEILQCGIDYFNNSDDVGRHQTAMKMQEYAQSIVEGSFAKQRCEENVKILQRLIDELPPDDVRYYNDYICNKIDRFLGYKRMGNPTSMALLEESMNLVSECAPYLASIKEISGETNAYYINISTKVINTILNTIIEVVNKVIQSLSSTFNVYTIRIEDARAIICEAYKLMFIMHGCDMDDEYRANRFHPNLESILDIAGSAKVLTKDIPVIDKRSDRKIYLDCATVEDCDKYFNIFPEGKYTKEVLLKKEKFRFETCITNADCDALLRDYPHRKQEIEEIREKISYDDCDTFKDCHFYLRKYPNGKYKQQVLEILDNLLKKELDKCESVDQYESFINTYGDSKYVQEAIERKDALIAKKRREKIIKTILYILGVIIIIVLIGCAYWYSEKRKQEAELQAEQQARQAKQAVEDLYNKIISGDTLSCTLFIDNYPNNEHIDEVKKILEEYEYHHLTTIDDFIEFKAKHPLSQYTSSADSVIDERAEKLKVDLQKSITNYDLPELDDFIRKYRNVENKSIQSVVEYVRESYSQRLKEEQEKEEKARQDSIRKEEEAKKRAEYERYGTDANAWKTASSENSISAYQDYMRRYPRGRHVDAANKKIIDFEVQSVINSGDYGYLPSSQKVSYETGRYSTINISSRCNQIITIMYSGVKSTKIVLSPYQSRKVVLPSGTYKVVATSPGVRSFYGNENLTGGTYESEYYIETRRY